MPRRGRLRRTPTPRRRAPAAATSDVERIAELYSRSVELYSQGELAAARQGFVEVQKSGLFKGAEGKRPEDYIATIDRLQAGSQPTQVPAQPTPVPAAQRRTDRRDVGPRADPGDAGGSGPRSPLLASGGLRAGPHVVGQWRGGPRAGRLH